jgi:spermidine synthase
MLAVMLEKPSSKLFFLGFLTLFLELVLIRYLSGNIWNLGYFPNLVLLAVFLGMGTGFSFHHKISDMGSKRLFPVATIILALLIAFASIGHPTFPGFDGWGANFGGDLYFTARQSIPFWLSSLMFVFWFAATFAIFFFISQRTAKLFGSFAPLKAYTLDIAGSCGGIVTFMIMSWFQIPAHIWFVIVLALFLLSDSWTKFSLKNVATPVVALAVCFCFARFQDIKMFNADPDQIKTVEVKWSPYQKLKFLSKQDNPDSIFANGIPHQTLLPAEEVQRIFYRIPYTKRAADPKLPKYERVLVLGSGAGNDVTAALANGASHVDAVEIDPVIAEFGKKYNPAKPYQDSRVTVTIDDGRAFMTRAKEKYDLIIFALTDSLVKVSPMGQLRLENYLFTEESVRKASQLLTDGGDLLFYNFYRRPWITDKIEKMVYNASGYAPVRQWQDKDFVVMMAGKYNHAKSEGVDSLPVDTPKDNWPFLYLQERGIPTPYIAAMVGLSLIVILLMGILNVTAPKESGRADLATKLAFTFMGIAFMLLETKSVIQFALLFGTTWLNNSLVFLGVLLLVLAANWTASFVKKSFSWMIFLCLILSCCLPLVFPLSGLLEIENVAIRYVVASLITFSPIYFANLIFSVEFRDQEVAAHVFGWNLIGACLGGVVEYSSLALGYSALAFIVMACYALVYFLVAVGNRVHAVSPLRTEGEVVA